MAVNIDKAIKTIQKAGFSHIKVELEAHLDRSGTYDGRIRCEDCNAMGIIDILNSVGTLTGREECRTCRATGYRGGKAYNLSDSGSCQEFIKDQLNAETKKAINFMRFYYDGSVDSELTFTMPADKIELVLDVIAAWNKLDEVCGGNMIVTGAGMHMSVLPTSTYPCRNYLPEANINNFRSEVGKLLPALYIAGTSGAFTRGLRYRLPEITTTKYGAISTHGNTCLEYRLFETC
jgi:hypothetical protein